MADPFVLLLAGLALIFLIITLLWPEKGLIGNWKHYRRLTIRVLTEDVLKYLYHHEIDKSSFTLQDISDTLGITSKKADELLTKLEQQGFIAFLNGQPELTVAGRIYALHIIRAHRLWESLLADQSGFRQTEWHSQAECREHELTLDEVNRLAVRLNHPVYDPHGSPIPYAHGLLEKHAGKPLTCLDMNQPARIVHIEDKEEAIYAQLIAEELSPGMGILVVEKTTDRIVFLTEGDEHILAPLLAKNISVVELPKTEAFEFMDAERLSTLDIGEKAEILAISRFCYGAERRRLFDLGFTKGTVVEVSMASAGGDPIAYRIRGTLIALRSEQARLILIKRISKHQAQHGQQNG